MEIDITIKNYRGFSDNNPARIKLKKGFISFVGINNSGKSSVLRFFYEFRELFGVFGDLDRISRSLRGEEQFGSFLGAFDQVEVFHNQNDREITIELETDIPKQEESNEIYRVKFKITVPKARTSFISNIEIDGAVMPPDDMTINNSGVFRVIRPQEINLLPLREACLRLQNTLYIGPFRNILNLGDQPNYYDISAGQSFIKQWRQIKEGNNKTNNLAAIKLTNDIKRIFDYEALEINPSANDETLTVAINGQSYKLPELGSGITQFIIVLANASIKKPAYILIDEPELNLHPSLQLDFLTTLASYSTEAVLFATHSIGLARSASDLIYSVYKNNQGESIVKILEDTPELAEFLGELSFSGYKELGFDKILLVEGSTDVKAIQQFLRFYKKEHKVVLLPLGGSGMINDRSYDHLEEVKRISTKVYALIDSEKVKKENSIETKRQKFADSCKKAGIKCHILTYRALENYLTDEAIKKIKGDKYRALTPYESMQSVQPIWAKEENWRIAREMNVKDIEGNDLGKFLKSL